MNANAILETHVAATARTCLASCGGDDSAAREAAERELADSLERWAAEWLASIDGWPLGGRWYDGLVISEFRPDAHGRLNLRGHIWTIGQEQCHFQAVLELDDERIAAFDFRLSEPRPGAARNRHSAHESDQHRIEPEWTFQFRS